MNNAPVLPYAVSLFGSHPDLDNDDCWTGTKVATLDEARAIAFDPWSHFNRVFFASDSRWVEIDGPDVNEVVAISGAPKRRAADASDWQNEHAMQMGMGLGCDGYNDAGGRR